MAKWEIHKRFGLIQYLWWRYMPGTVIIVQWPVGDLVHGDTLITSADPNDHYRPDLEKHCGRQGWDWDWKIASDMTDAPKFSSADKLAIKMRKKHEYLASYFAVKWA